MKGRICILFLAALVATSFTAPAQEPKPQPAAKPLVVEPAKPAAAAKPTATATGRRELTLRQRRELGLTIPKLAAIAKELKEDGEIDRDTPRAEIAALIATRLEEKNPQAFAATDAGEGLDIQSIIDLIERLLPFILKLIDLFS